MKKIIAYVHTHWDREWYREFEEFRLRLIEVFDDILSKLESGDLPSFYFDGQTSALEDYLEIHPENTRLVKDLIKQKRLFIGPFFCSADQFLTGGESLLRNLKIGLEKSEEFGEKEFLAYLSDTFGHCVSMSSILKAANLDNAVLWRGLGDLPADLLWNGIKTTYLIQGYFNDFLNCNLDFDKKAELLKKYIDKIAVKSGENILLPIGADHLKACDDLKNQIEKLNKKYEGEYEIIIGSPFDYFSSIDNNNRRIVTGEFLDNSLNFILQGVYSSRNDIKKANFDCEKSHSEAEMFSAINATTFNKKSRQKELDYAYKMLVKNHAHDSIYGCSTDKVSREVLTRLEKVQEIADGITKRCIRDLNSDKGFSAINLSNSKFSGVVEIQTDKKLPSWLKSVVVDKKQGFPEEILYDINRIPVTEDYTNIYTYAVKIKDSDAFSTKNITKNDILSVNDIKTTKNSLENKFLSFEIKNNKISVTDKKNHKIYHDFIKITDVADIGDSYNFGPLKDDKTIFAKIKSVKIINKKLFAAALIETEIKIPEKSTDKRRSLIAPRHKISIEIKLNSENEFATFNLKWANKSKDHKLQLMFNTGCPIRETVSEDLFGLTKRKFNPEYDIQKLIPAPRGKELKTSTMPVNRFAFANGVGIISGEMKEVEISDKDFGYTLLRATGVISNPKNSSRGTPAGPPIETPELQMIGEQTAFVAVSFVQEPNELFEICDKIFNPPILIFGNSGNKDFIKNDNKNIRITTVKQADDGNLVLRAVNYSDTKQAVELKFGKKLLFETDLQEKKKIPTNGILYFEPFEIKTVKFE